MKDRTTRQFDAFLRSCEFKTINAARIPADSFATTLFTRLNQITTKMQAASSQQASGARASQEATASKSLARQELIEDLMRVSRTARGMRRTMPGLEDKFRSPGRMSDQELLAVARAFAADALPLKDEFIRRGLRADFIEDLNEDIEKFEEALTRQTRAGSSKVSGTAAIEELAAEGMETLRELDPIIRNIFEDDTATLATWLSARHVERAPRRKREETPTKPNP